MRYLLLVLMLMFSTSVYANCYSSAEFEAEQGLRIHSELMVIALNCDRTKYARGNLQIQYRDFTRQHQDLIFGYEQTLKNYYKRSGAYNPEKQINDLRTELANKISNDAARMRPNVFCKVYGSRIADALGMSRKKLKRWASTPFSNHPVSRPICAKG